MKPTQQKSLIIKMFNNKNTVATIVEESLWTKSELQNVNFLHGAKPSNLILPQEKRKNLVNLALQLNRTKLIHGEQMLTTLSN